MNDKAKEQAREATVKEIVRIAHQNQVITNAELATFRDGVYFGYDAGYKAAQRWTRVSEGLPEIADVYLVRLKSISVVEVASYLPTSNRWLRDSEFHGTVIAWMPIPPLEENNE